VPKNQREAEVLIRGVHDQIIAGLMRLHAEQLRADLLRSRVNHGNRDVGRELEMALELHQHTDKWFLKCQYRLKLA